MILEPDVTVLNVDSFEVAGLTVRTKNSDEFNPETAKLPNLWQQFFSNNPALSPDTSIFGVYSGYESDANGLYDVTVGTLNNDQNEHAELCDIEINAGSYLVFQGKGPMPQTVIETWKRVWEYFTADSPFQRSYITDFEEYTNGDEVAIYIGVK